MLLSPESEAVVKATAAVVAEHAVAITSRFYPSMFEAHPELLNLFNMGNQASGEQRQALASAVVAYAVHLLDPDAPSFAAGDAADRAQARVAGDPSRAVHDRRAPPDERGRARCSATR